MAKEIIYNPDACRRLMAGIDQVAKAVAVTFGSSGPAVVIQHRTDGVQPIVSRDGVTVANSIGLQDRIADLGARMLRDIAGAVSREVGDGTTTAVVIAQVLARECLKSIAAGFHPLKLKQGLELALTLVQRELARNAAKDVSPDWIEKIAAVATKNEAGVGKLLTEAFSALGEQGRVTFQLGLDRNDRLEIVEGLHYEQGYLSPYFITDKSRSEAILEDPYLLLYDREIDDLMDLVPILEAVKERNRPLLIVAESVADKALTGLLLNHVRGVFKAVAVKPPGFGDKRVDRLKDLAVLTGGQAILKEKFKRLQDVDLSQLGQAKRAIIGETGMMIIGGAGNTAEMAALSDKLQREADLVRARKPGQGSPTGNQHELEELEERIAALAGKTGLYHVGGTSDMEIKERMVRIENAYKSAQAALQEGVIPGCGIGLYRCRNALKDVIADDAEQQRGIDIMKQAVAAPFNQLMANAGLNAGEIAAILETGGGDSAFDTDGHKFGPYLELGIMDPIKVVKAALGNAVSVIGTVIATDTVIMDVPDSSIMAGYSPEWAAATREDPRT